MHLNFNYMCEITSVVLRVLGVNQLDSIISLVFRDLLVNNKIKFADAKMSLFIEGLKGL